MMINKFEFYYVGKTSLQLLITEFFIIYAVYKYFPMLDAIHTMPVTNQNFPQCSI